MCRSNRHTAGLGEVTITSTAAFYWIITQAAKAISWRKQQLHSCKSCSETSKQVPSFIELITGDYESEHHPAGVKKEEEEKEKSHYLYYGKQNSSLWGLKSTCRRCVRAYFFLLFFFLNNVLCSIREQKVSPGSSSSRHCKRAANVPS